jgi:hypothetical protein
MTQSFDWDKPIEDTSGHPAKVISKDFRIGWHTLHVVQIDMGSTGSFVRYYYPDGSEYRSKSSIYPPHALRNKKEKREGWVNVYHRYLHGTASKSSDLITGRLVYPTERAANEYVLLTSRHNDALTHVATLKIEVEI